MEKIEELQRAIDALLARIGAQQQELRQLVRLRAPLVMFGRWNPDATRSRAAQDTPLATPAVCTRSTE